jgi:hypothetical protein
VQFGKLYNSKECSIASHLEMASAFEQMLLSPRPLSVIVTQLAILCNDVTIQASLHSVAQSCSEPILYLLTNYTADAAPMPMALEGTTICRHGHNTVFPVAVMRQQNRLLLDSFLSRLYLIIGYINEFPYITSGI